jgi:hypothetical protein
MRLGEAFKTTTMVWQGIRPTHIESAFAMPDQVDPFELPGPASGAPRVRLLLKALNQLRRPSYLVGLEVQRSIDPEPILMDAWRVPQDWVRPDPRPKQVMEAVCRECGWLIRAGAREEYLIIAERIPLAPGHDPQVVIAEQVPKDAQVITRFFFRLAPDNHLDVAVAYALDGVRVRLKLGPRRS